MKNFKEEIQNVIETEPIKKYNLKFAGIGEENICFETEGSSKKLIKVDIHTLRNKVADLLMNGEQENNPESYSEQKELINEIKQQEQNLKEVFGDTHILKGGVFRSKIPLSKQIILGILSDDEKKLAENLDEKIYEVKMLIKTQEIAKELKNPELFKTEDFSTDLITYDNFKKSKDISEALLKIEFLVDNNFIKDMKQKILDKKYSNTIKEITEKIIKYSKKTGLMLDIFGPENITMFINEKGEADFHLVDVIMPGSIKIWNKNLKDDEKLDLLRHYYTFFYSIKSLAKEIGIKDNLTSEDLIYFKDTNIPSGDFPKSEVSSQIPR